MDYNLLLKTLQSYVVDQRSSIEGAQKIIAAIDPENAFEQRLFSVLTHAVSCFEVNEALKKITATILEEGEFFSNQEIHRTTKIKFLEKILKDNNYVKNNRQFNLSAIQTYVATIIHKQLYEINIKIEENQRSLNKLEAAATRRRQSIVEESESSLEEKSSAPLEDTSAPSKETSSSSSISTSSTSASPLPQPSLSSSSSQYLLIEIEKSQCAINYDDIVEILKFDKPVPEKVLALQTIPHHKLLSFNRRNVLKQMEAIPMDKKQLLTNRNASLENREGKHFAVLTRKEADCFILFVDYIEYTEPVDGQDMGKYARTTDGDYKKM